MTGDSIFQQVKERVRIADVAGDMTKLRGGKNSLRGACPIDDCGVRSKSMPFQVWPGKGTFKCWSCGKAGDAVELAVQVWGETPLEAARRLLGAGYEPPAPRTAKDDRDAERDEKRRLELAAEIWEGSKPIAGTRAERYLLEARKIHPAVVAAAQGAMRYHPFAPHHWQGDKGAWFRASALLLRPRTVAGFTGGVHATYLLSDGTGRDKALGKKMWGPQTDPEGRPGAAWLIGPVGPNLDGSPLVVGEGCESALSLASMAAAGGRRVRVAAALSLDRLQGGIARDDDRCMDVAAPRGDPARPAFTWPCPEQQPWPEVIIGVDGDMRPWKTLARTGRGKAIEVVLEAPARADLCGRLASQAWRATGVTARAIRPPGLQDFNDEWRRQLAAQEGRDA